MYRCTFFTLQSILLLLITWSRRRREGIQTESDGLLLFLSVNNRSVGVLGPFVQKRPKRQQKELKISAML